jgi:hypothetical protein
LNSFLEKIWVMVLINDGGRTYGKMALRGVTYEKLREWAL